MEMTSPMQSKPLVNATCKLGKNGCYEDGRCHYIGNCVSKIETNADRIRAMTDEELVELVDCFISSESCSGSCRSCSCLFICRTLKGSSTLGWLKQPCEDSPTVEKG